MKNRANSRRRGRSTGATPRCAAAAAAACAAAGAAAQPAAPVQLATVPVATVSAPVFVTAPAGDAARAFIVEQGGGIRIFELGTHILQAEPFLTVSPVVWQSERGLLGMAFHPQYAENGYFWVYHNVPDGAVVARYRAVGDPMTATAADPESRQVVLHIPGLTANHNAGWMGFAPDGHLFVFTGEGGRRERAQQITDQLAGKLLRIDVDGADGVPGTADDDGFPADANRLYTVPADNPFVGVTGDDEIWAYGLRNPWRNDIDPLTGDLFIADVGAHLWEEVNFQPLSEPGSMPGDAGYVGGRNYGWDCYEGDEPYEGMQCGPEGMTFPFLVYGHVDEVPPTGMVGCSITGGVVYRGCVMPGLRGSYFFTDYCEHRVFTVRYDGTTVSDVTERTAELDPPGKARIRFIVSFGRDGLGEVYICAQNTVHKIVPEVLQDVNGDGVADGCRCPADWDSDGATNSTDVSAFLSAWVAAVMGGPAGGDYDGSGVTNSSDISAFLVSWLAALRGGC